MIPLSRRRALAVIGAAALGACADLSALGSRRIVETASGRELGRDELLDALRASDFALLGELHDNPYHHVARGEVLAALGASVPVVAEHLPRGQRVRFGGDLERSLVDAGFDTKGWGWPMHQPLFAAIAEAGIGVEGGNAARDLARRIAREGPGAVPPELRALLDEAPLADKARTALADDLVAGHCGQLGGTLLENITWAQRTRDASMTLALFDAQAGRAPAGPVVLLAGNGHVRRDYGVPQLIGARRPRSRVASVGFVEAGTRFAPGPYTHLWVTERAERADPCRDMPRLPRPASARAPGSGGDRSASGRQRGQA